MSIDMRQAIELFGIGMGGIFVVMFLLFLISQIVLKLTAPKKGDE